MSTVFPFTSSNLRPSRPSWRPEPPSVVRAPAMEGGSARHGGRVGGLPGVGLGGGTGPGEDVVESAEDVLAQVDLQGPEGAVELLHRAGADDRGGDTVLVQQPRQCDVGRLLAEFVAQVFPLAQ